MEKTDKKILEEIIRVDHAGERGAIKIYEGQLLAQFWLFIILVLSRDFLKSHLLVQPLIYRKI